jgi:[ribosomal protein S5]-alanine N-acetyltransferase
MFDLTITTERLKLRPYQLADAKRLQLLAGAWEVAAMLYRMPHPYPDGEAERWIATHVPLRQSGRGFIFAIETDDALAGSVSFEDTGRTELEVGYWLGVPYWGKGLMTEAASAVVELAFSCGHARLCSGYFVENQRSGRVLEKIGFTKTEIETRFHKLRNQEIQVVRMELTRDAWAAKSA